MMEEYKIISKCCKVSCSVSDSATLTAYVNLLYYGLDAVGGNAGQRN